MWKEYRKVGIRVVFGSSKNLQQILASKNKPKLEKNSNSGVYEVPCSCGAVYIGETALAIKTRVKQHQRDVFEGKWMSSGLAEHSRTCTHDINWSDVSTRKAETNTFLRKVREALEIQHATVKKAIVLNRDSGNYVTTSSWQPLLKKLTANGR